ncbi:MAG: hypothetical protein H7306_09525 [Bacteriovorax sp.]|nr:hypothetical protein [Rhizobacter sp.]
MTRSNAFIPRRCHVQADDPGRRGAAAARCAGAGRGSGSGSGSTPAEPAALQRELFAAERSFARSMAKRDLAAFSRQRSKQAVFFDTPVC